VPRVAVPFHLHERRADLILPFEPEVVVTGPEPSEPTWAGLAALYDKVATVVADADPDDPPVVFAGDCCVTTGVLAGLARRGIDPGVVWVDGHGDFNTPETTISGYPGGMVLSLITGRGERAAVAGLGREPVSDERVVLVDARDLDPAESDLLDASGVRRAGVDDAAAMVRSALGDGPIFLHVDLDVLDPGDLPGLMFPAAGGPTLDTVVGLVRAVAETGQIAAASIGCTWHPAEADPDRCREVVRAVVGALGC
jgi:arginase